MLCRNDGARGVFIFKHEIGHNFGFGHSGRIIPPAEEQVRRAYEKHVSSAFLVKIAGLPYGAPSAFAHHSNVVVVGAAGKLLHVVGA